MKNSYVEIHEAEVELHWGPRGKGRQVAGTGHQSVSQSGWPGDRRNGFLQTHNPKLAELQVERDGALHLLPHQKLPQLWDLSLADVQASRKQMPFTSAAFH